MLLNELQHIYPVSRETFERLQILVEGVRVWQAKTNLVAPSTLDDIWNRHICDSLQCVTLRPDARNWVDIGSGGGFPGLVIAAVMADYSGSSVTLVESNQKKCAFLRQMNRQMGSHATILSKRIEEVASSVAQPQIVTARALAELPLLLELSSPWLLSGAAGLFHKGREYRAELAKCDGAWSFDLVEHKSKISSDSVLLEIINLRRKNK